VHSGRIESASREDMMHQVSMYASVAVLERMNIDESKREDRRRDNGVEFVLGGMVERDQARHERGNIFMPRADMVRDRLLRIAVVLADEAAFLTEAESHETLVADNDALKPQKFLLV
jgi:hypothetical protein